MEKQQRHFAIDRTLTTTKQNLPPFNVLRHPSLPFCWLSQMSPLLQSVCQVSVSLSGLTGDCGGPLVVVMCPGRSITDFPRFISAVNADFYRCFGCTGIFLKVFNLFIFEIFHGLEITMLKFQVKFPSVP